jgi:hypothetical protein
MCCGLTNAPDAFQRLMEKCIGEKHLKDCLIFLHAILIFSNTFEQHCQRLEKVFKRLADNGLKLKPSKCDFFKNYVECFGHIISADGISTYPKKSQLLRIGLHLPLSKNYDSVWVSWAITGNLSRTLPG